MYQFNPLQSFDYLYKTLIELNVAADKNNSHNEIWNWTKDEIGVAVTKFVLNASWNQDLMVQ